MVDNQEGYLGMSKILSEDVVNPTALFIRDLYSACLLFSANLIYVFHVLFEQQLIGEQTESHWLKSACLLIL